MQQSHYYSPQLFQSWQYAYRDELHLHLPIPQIEIVGKVEQYRPISLCNFIYKIIYKFSLDRISAYLPEFYNMEQYSFVKGRVIFTNIVWLERWLGASI